MKLEQVIYGWGLALLTLHIMAYQLPVAQAWGVWPYTFLPPALGWLLAGLVASLIIPAVNDKVSHAFCLLASKVFTKQTERFLPLVLALSTGVLFYLARLQHLRWGDSYWLTVLLSYPELEHRVIYNWQAPFTVFLHQRLWQFVADPLFGWSVENVYATVSIIAGMAFIYILFIFTRDLGRNGLEQAVLFGLVASTGTMQLFFGYVENYTLVTVGLLITLWLAWRTSVGHLQPLWPVLSLAITNGFHPSTVFLWPGMVWLVWQTYRRQEVAVWDGMVQLIFPPALIGGGIFAMMEMGGHGLSALTGVDRPGGGDAIWFVPLLSVDEANQWQRYTIFSSAHLLDWANLHLLISPFGLLIIGWGVWSLVSQRQGLERQRFTLAERDYIRFLSLTSGLYILLTFVWNADYGMHKDWDLFSPSAIVYTLLVGVLLIRLIPQSLALRRVALFAVSTSFVHTTAWIWTNMQTLPELN